MVTRRHHIVIAWLGVLLIVLVTIAAQRLLRTPEQAEMEREQVRAIKNMNDAMENLNAYNRGYLYPAPVSIAPPIILPDRPAYAPPVYGGPSRILYVPQNGYYGSRYFQGSFAPVYAPPSQVVTPRIPATDTISVDSIRPRILGRRDASGFIQPIR
jgi:hypothetical protein